MRCRGQIIDDTERSFGFSGRSFRQNLLVYGNAIIAVVYEVSGSLILVPRYVAVLADVERTCNVRSIASHLFDLYALGLVHPYRLGESNIAFGVISILYLLPHNRVDNVFDILLF